MLSWNTSYPVFLCFFSSIINRNHHSFIFGIVSFLLYNGRMFRSSCCWYFGDETCNILKAEYSDLFMLLSTTKKAKWKLVLRSLVGCICHISNSFEIEIEIWFYSFSKIPLSIKDRVFRNKKGKLANLSWITFLPSFFVLITVGIYPNEALHRAAYWPARGKSR